MLLCLILTTFFVFGFMGQSFAQVQEDAVAAIAWQTPARVEEFADLARGIAERRPPRWEEFQELGKDLARQEQSRVAGQAAEMAGSVSGGDRMLVFVTLGDKPFEHTADNRRLLKDIQASAPGAVVVLRGLPQGSRTLGDLVKYVRQITDKDSPPVILNPVLFRRYDVTVSPTLVYEKDGLGVAWARGIVNSQWLKRRIEQYKATGDQGKWGETMAIAERDFIDEMKSRLAGIDWQAKKEQAVAHYWKKQKFIELPKAREEKIFYLDAIYQVEKDFVLPDGKVIARAGERIDLFKVVPPTFMLVVFDAADPQQVEWAKLTGEGQSGKNRVKYIATRIPEVERGWESLEGLQRMLAAPVYLLNEPVRERFKLVHAPSTVRFDKDKHKFEVKEVPISAGEERPQPFKGPSGVQGKVPCVP